MQITKIQESYLRHAFSVDPNSRRGLFWSGVAASGKTALVRAIEKVLDPTLPGGEIKPHGLNRKFPIEYWELRELLRYLGVVYGDAKEERWHKFNSACRTARIIVLDEVGWENPKYRDTVEEIFNLVIEKTKAQVILISNLAEAEFKKTYSPYAMSRLSRLVHAPWSAEHCPDLRNHEVLQRELAAGVDIYGVLEQILPDWLSLWHPKQ